MKLSLEPHPGTPPGPVKSIEAIASRERPDWLALSFVVAGDIATIAWPGGEQHGFEGWQRGDELWHHTCFEVFGRIDGVPGYWELNFATSGQWAAYRFDAYREGIRSADDVSLTAGRWNVDEHQAQIEAVVHIPPEYGEAAWEIGLSAVIEEKSGRKSYWALAHPSDKPDFHHPACFAAALPAPPRG